MSTNIGSIAIELRTYGKKKIFPLVREENDFSDMVEGKGEGLRWQYKKCDYDIGKRKGKISKHIYP